MRKIIYSAALTLTLTLGACNMTEDFSPQEILNQAMQETSDITSYYAEYTMTLEDENRFTAKQWEKNGKTRIEMTEVTGEESITVNDGKNLTMYSKTENSGSTYSITEDMEGYVQPTLKEQAIRALELVKNSHNISIGDDEKIAGRDTYHLMAKAKEKGSLIGDIEFWVDKKTWMTLKTVTTTEDMHLIMEFTKFEPNAKVEDSQFVLEIPEDAVMENFENEMPAQITVEEAKALLGDFLAFPESTGYELLSIENMQVPETNEIALTYLKDGEPAFTLSIFKPMDGTELSQEGELIIHGLPAEKIDNEFFKHLQWDENGLRYGIIFDNLELTFEEVLALTESMQVIQ